MARVAIFMLLRTFKIPGCGHMGRCILLKKEIILFLDSVMSLDGPCVTKRKLMHLIPVGNRLQSQNCIRVYHLD